MQRTELILLSVWTAAVAVIILAVPDSAVRPEGWRVPLGILFFAPGALTTVVLTVSSDRFQRLICRKAAQ